MSLERALERKAGLDATFFIGISAFAAATYPVCIAISFMKRRLSALAQVRSVLMAHQFESLSRQK
jgi:hypothetical protein